MIGSRHTPTKFTNMSSATGLSPVTAAPTAAPMKPISQIGVSMTRSGPKRWIRPLVAPMGPPQASMNPWSARPAPPATSSPIRITVGSRSISWRRASFSARLNSSSLAMTLPCRVHVGRQRRERRRLARLGEPDRLLDHARGLLVDGPELGLGQRPTVHHGALEARDAIPSPVVGLLLGGAVATGIVADEVAVVTVGLALEEAWPAAGSRSAHRPAHLAVDGEHVLAIDGGGGDAERLGASRQVLGPQRVLDRGRLGIAVVLAHEDHGQLPDRAHVQALVDQPLPHGAIPKEGHRHLVGAARPGREGGAQGHGHPGSNP